MTALGQRRSDLARGAVVRPLLARRRDPSTVWVLAALVLCLVLGVVAGLKPTYALLGVIAIGFVALVLADLVAGISAFAALSFLDTLSSGGTAFSVTKVIGLLLVLSWLLNGATRSRAAARDILREHSTLFAWLAAYLAWTALSALWAQSPGTALTLVYRYVLNILLIPIIYSAVSTRRDLTRIVLGYLVGAGFSTIYGLVHPAGASGQIAAGRVVGALGDANQTAESLVAGLALAAGTWILVRGAPRLRLLVGATALLALVGVVTSVSRSGLLAFGAVLITGLVIGGRWRRPLAWVAAAALVGVAGYFFVLAPATSRNRITSTQTSGRSSIWTVALRAFAAHPVLGIGAGNFPLVSRDYLQQPGQITAALYIVTQPKVEHNIYLEQLDELGVPGLIMLLGIFVSVIMVGLRAAHIFERVGDVALELLSRGWIMALMAFLAADFFLPGLTLKQLWLVIALAPALLKLARTEASRAEQRAP